MFTVAHSLRKAGLPMKTLMLVLALLSPVACVSAEDHPGIVGSWLTEGADANGVTFHDSIAFDATGKFTETVWLTGKNSDGKTSVYPGSWTADGDAITRTWDSGFSVAEKYSVTAGSLTIGSVTFVAK